MRSAWRRLAPRRMAQRASTRRSTVAWRSGAFEYRPAQVGRAEVGAGQARAAQVEAAEVGAAQVEAGEVDRSLAGVDAGLDLFACQGHGFPSVGRSARKYSGRGGPTIGSGLRRGHHSGAEAELRACGGSGLGDPCLGEQGSPGHRRRRRQAQEGQEGRGDIGQDAVGKRQGRDKGGVVLGAGSDEHVGHRMGGVGRVRAAGTRVDHLLDVAVVGCYEGDAVDLGQRIQQPTEAAVRRSRPR